MELVNALVVYSFTAFLLSFLVAKLISLAISSADVGPGKESRPDGVREGDSENRLKVEGLKSLKKKAKKISAQTVRVSEFKGESEPAFAAEAVDCFDDRKELGSGEKNPEFLGTEASEACSADRVLSAGEDGGLESYVIQRLEDCFGVDGPRESEGLISSSEINLYQRTDVEGKCNEVGCSAEGFEQEIKSGNDDKLVVCDQSTDYKQDDVAGEETESCDFYHQGEVIIVGNTDQDLAEKLMVYDQSTDHKEDDVAREETQKCGFYHQVEVGSVGPIDQDLVNDVIPSGRREVCGELYEQDEGRERIEPRINAGLLAGENVVDDQHEHHMILESLETESNFNNQEAFADKLDDQKEELGPLLSAEDVVNRDEEGKIDKEGKERSEPKIDCKEDDVAGEETERCVFYHKGEVGSIGHNNQELVNDDERREVYKQDEGRERIESKVDDAIDAENAVDDQHEHHSIFESMEIESEVHAQEVYADKVDGHNEEHGSLVSTEDVVTWDEEGRVDDKGTERSLPTSNDISNLGISGCQNALDDQQQHRLILESVETEPKDGTQDGYFNQVDYQIEEIRVEEVRIGDEGKGEMDVSDGEEWEGIERNELERVFAKALNFVECGKKGQLSRLGSDVMMQFYGLQKVSMEGPCHELPPMALKLSARAKWNAWQKLGNMIPEEAMEKYINLLTDKAPGWMGEHSSVEDKLCSEVDGQCGSSDTNSHSISTLPLTCIDESIPGEEPVTRAADLTENSTALNKDEE